MLSVNNGTYGVAEVAEQVPAIRNLDRIWRALPRAVGIGACPVACDDLDARVLT